MEMSKLKKVLAGISLAVFLSVFMAASAYAGCGACGPSAGEGGEKAADTASAKAGKKAAAEGEGTAAEGEGAAGSCGSSSSCGK
ncbi:MAG: hypothetical protein HQL30_07630 [Candidatus Omnitrophica bacterium]|nr:hypothetical protein [Candidatus Omnitrophota bacterium]